jgi:hypothetical protein
LLARLLLEANRTVSVDALVDALWGERVPATAVKMVHIYVSQLRKRTAACRLELGTTTTGIAVGFESRKRGRTRTPTCRPPATCRAASTLRPAAWARVPDPPDPDLEQRDWRSRQDFQTGRDTSV